MSDEGRLVAGRYRVQRRIGSGAMGVVWECVDEVLDRTVAVKRLLLQPGLAPEDAEEARQRARREGRIAARLQHYHAISVYDVTEDEGQPVLVMEYLPSTSLSATMAEQGWLPPQTVARIGSQVAAALSAAHAAGVVHRDIKPENILLGDDGTVKITDFGISRMQGDVQVTQTGIVAGTPAYLSPDVARGQEPTPASDVFSLGSTLYAAIEGQPPFGLNENSLALLHTVAGGKINRPVRSGPMTRPLMEMLQNRVEDRPTMAQVQEMLEGVTDGRTVGMVPTPVPIPSAALDGGVGALSMEPTTTIPGSRLPEVEDTKSDGKESKGRETGGEKDGGADTDTDGPQRNWRPLGVSFLAQVAAAMMGMVVTAAFWGGQDRGDVPPNQNATQPAPPPAPVQSAPLQPGPPPSTTDSAPIVTTTQGPPAPTTTDTPTTTTGAAPVPGPPPGGPGPGPEPTITTPPTTTLPDTTTTEPTTTPPTSTTAGP